MGLTEIRNWRRKSEHYWHHQRKAQRESGKRYPSFSQVPGPWRVARLAGRVAARRSGKPLNRLLVSVWFEWLFTRPKMLLMRSGTARFAAEVLSAAVIVGTVVSFWQEFENRREDLINRAWTLIAASKENTGNIGLVDALHTLQRYGIKDLTRLTLPGAYLAGVRLPGLRVADADFQKADLRWADLQGTKLARANLRGASLMYAYLQGASLIETHLEGANLRDAHLEGANLEGANLRKASLEWADLSDAELSFVDLSNKTFEAAELGGADYLFSNLTGTFLDINQPPPDVLPAP